MNKITGALVFCLAALMGIPSLAAAQDKVPPNAELLVGAEPAVGKEAVGTVGSTIFAQFRYWHKKGLVADGMVSTWIALNPVIINKGDFLVKLTDKKGDVAFLRRAKWTLSGYLCNALSSRYQLGRAIRSIALSAGMESIVKATRRACKIF